MFFTHEISPILVEIGPIAIRWYGLLFASGILLNYLILRWIFKREGLGFATLDSIVIYLFVGLVVGARLGEVLFYEPAYFFSNPLEIFMVWKGGLSSHGAAIGLFVSYVAWLWVHRGGTGSGSSNGFWVRFARYVDLIVIPMPLTAFFVRMGNFFNSEIVGKATGGDYGVVFSRLGEDFPRHPAMLYEGIWSLVVFGILMFLYVKGGGLTANGGLHVEAKNRVTLVNKPLFFMFLYIFLYFSGRFFIEFFKDVNSLPESFFINTGQLLSLVPVVIALIWFASQAMRKKRAMAKRK